MHVCMYFFRELKNGTSIKIFKTIVFKIGIADLLINVWSYNDPDHSKCYICKTSEKWCVELTREQCQTNF